MAKEIRNTLTETEIYEVSDFFKLFGDSTRLSILYALENNPMCGNDMCKIINITKSAASHQLKILKKPDQKIRFSIKHSLYRAFYLLICAYKCYYSYNNIYYC